MLTLNCPYWLDYVCEEEYQDREALSEFAKEILESYTADYCIGQDVIYAAFAWSVAEEAYELMRRLAQKHNVGFYGVSEDDNIILPDGTVIV